MHSFHHSRPRREAFGHLSGAVSFRVWRFTLSGDVRGMAAAESKTELVQAFSRDDVLAHSLQLPHVSQLHAFPRQLPSQRLNVVEAPAPTMFAPRGTSWMSNVAPLPTGLSKTWHNLHCGLRHSLLYFSSSSSPQDWIRTALWGLSMPSPASTAFIFL